MINYLKKVSSQKSLVDMKTVFQNMAMDVIAVCAFGIETNCFEDPNNEIMVHGRAFFSGFRMTDYMSDIMWRMFLSIKSLSKVVNVFPIKTYDALFNISKSIQSQRESSGPGSGDFIDRLVELKRQVKSGEMRSVTE